MSRKGDSKKTILIIFATAMGAISTMAEIPPEIAQLQAQRHRQVAKIDKVYLSELEKLKVKYTKAGDLEGANLVVSLMKNTKGGLADAEFKVEGTWRLDFSHTKNSQTRKFEDGKMIDGDGGKHPFKMKDNVVMVQWNGSRNYFERLFIDLSKPDLMRGTNQDGHIATYTRVK